MEIQEFNDVLYEKKSLAFISLVKSNGKPHVTPVWFDCSEQETDLFLNVNIATGRIKHRYLVPGAPVAIAITDADDPYRYLGLDGTVTEVFDDEKIANYHKDALSAKYLDLERFPYYNENQKRIKVVIKLDNQYAGKKGIGLN